MGHSVSTQPDVPGSNFDFANIFFWRKTDMFSDESQNIKCHGWIFTE